jgi:hypothetical protein
VLDDKDNPILKKSMLGPIILGTQIVQQAYFIRVTGRRKAPEGGSTACCHVGLGSKFYHVEGTIRGTDWGIIQMEKRHFQVINHSGLLEA